MDHYGNEWRCFDSDLQEGMSNHDVLDWMFTTEPEDINNQTENFEVQENSGVVSGTFGALRYSTEAIDIPDKRSTTEPGFLTQDHTTGRFDIHGFCYRPPGLTASTDSTPSGFPGCRDPILPANNQHQPDDCMFLLDEDMEIDIANVKSDTIQSNLQPQETWCDFKNELTEPLAKFEDLSWPKQLTQPQGEPVGTAWNEQTTELSGPSVTGLSGPSVSELSGASMTELSGASITGLSGASISELSEASITGLSGASMTELSGASITPDPSQLSSTGSYTGHDLITPDPSQLSSTGSYTGPDLLELEPSITGFLPAASAQVTEDLVCKEEPSPEEREREMAFRDALHFIYNDSSADRRGVNNALMLSRHHPRLSASKWAAIFFFKLLSTDDYGHLIRWLNREKLIFQVQENQVDKVAKMWSESSPQKKFKSTWGNLTARIRYSIEKDEGFFQQFHDTEDSAGQPRKRTFRFGRRVSAWRS